MQQMKNIWSYHIWSFYNLAWRVDVPTLWQCQKPLKDHPDNKSWNTRVIWDDLSHLAPCPNGSSEVSIIWGPQTFHEISWLANIFCINFGQAFRARNSSVSGRLSYPKCVALSTMPQMMYSKVNGWICAVNPIRKPAAPEETAKEA